VWEIKAKPEIRDTNSISPEMTSALKNPKNYIKKEKENWLQKILEEARTGNICSFRK
jgi:hypothetical protein